MNSRTRQLITLGLLGLSAVSIASMAAAEMVQAPNSERQLVASDTAGGIRIEDRSGYRRLVEWPTDAQLESIRETSSGWVLTGRRSDRQANDLLIVTEDDGVVRKLRAPSPTSDVERHNPVALLDDNRALGAMAWLEGDDLQSLSVSVAFRHGRGWSRPQRVSSAGPGSQLALQGATLADGTWLLVWSAFDGNDDEILWSRRREGRWTKPRRLAENNQVPDVTPTLLADSAGVIVAWNWYDGNEYRVRTATFEENRWSPARLVTRSGSLSPRLIAQAGKRLLLHRNVVPGGWTVSELDTTGMPLVEATQRSSQAEAPALLEVGPLALTLKWETDSLTPLSWRVAEP